MYRKIIKNNIVYDNKIRFPQYVFVTLNNICNANCIFCDVNNAEKKKSIIDFYDVIKQLSEAGVKYIHFTGGGEPFVDKNIIDYCKYATELGLKIAFTTNGYALNKEKINELSKTNISHIVFSMDSHKAELHDQSRRVDGIWNKLTENIRLIKQSIPSVKIVINHVLTNKNIDSFIEMINLKKTVPYDFINPLFVKDNVRLYFSDDQLDRFKNSFEDYKNYANKLDVEFLYDDIEMYIQNANKNTINFACRVPDYCAFIDSTNANIYPCDCSVHRDCEWYSYGNVNEEKIKNIWISDRKKELAQKIKDNYCSCKASCDMANIYFNRFLEG